MKPFLPLGLILALGVLSPVLQGEDRILEVTYPASEVAGELSLGVTYRLWIPETPAPLRGVIVHQHGCGTGACQGGKTAADDVHWQALARKWNCALLGPSYHQVDGQNCRLWCDPRNGSNQTFLRCLDDFAKQAKRDELRTVPWCLWGHSGGAFWASLMQTLHPERIVAIWFRSGSAITAWQKKDIPVPEIPEAAYGIPMVCNPGAKEKDDPRFRGAWDGAVEMMALYRTRNAPIALAPDPRTAHECGDSRYLAIPYFDACLGLRLPEVGSTDQKLKPVDVSKGWIVPSNDSTAQPAALFSGDTRNSNWLPNETLAKAFLEYVKTGAVTDKTPPPAPLHVQMAPRENGDFLLTWQPVADFESGIQAFVIEHDGQLYAQIPKAPQGRFGRALWQAMSYHDTPEPNWPAAQIVIPKDKAQGEFRVRTVNSAGFKSGPSAAAVVVSGK